MSAITAAEMLTLRLVHRVNRWRWTFGSVAPSELRYLAILNAAIARSGIAMPPLYPLGPAANASLLYVLFRLLEDFPALDILELGAGQSSLLLDRLAGAGRVNSLLTLEHDADWIAAIQPRVAHEVRQAPLRSESVFGASVETYDAEFPRPFDCIIVDGPPGRPRQSRWGALKVLQQSLAGEYVVIFDDAERPGERDTIARFLSLHPEARHIFVHAMKSQCVVFTPRFARVASYAA